MQAREAGKEGVLGRKDPEVKEAPGLAAPRMGWELLVLLIEEPG